MASRETVRIIVISVSFYTQFLNSGEWYERLALILTTHIKNFPRAYHVVREALDDNDTHFIYRPKLVRRLQSLEKKLNTPEAERVKTPSLSPISAITIEGDRDWAPVEKKQKYGPRTPARKEDKAQQTRLIASTSKSVTIAVHQPADEQPVRTIFIYLVRS